MKNVVEVSTRMYDDVTHYAVLHRRPVKSWFGFVRIKTTEVGRVDWKVPGAWCAMVKLAKDYALSKDAEYVSRAERSAIASLR